MSLREFANKLPTLCAIFVPLSCRRDKHRLWWIQDENTEIVTMTMEILELPDRLLSERDAARYLCVSRSFLANSRWAGSRENGADAPPFIRIGRAGVRYRLSDLREWIAARRVSPRPFPQEAR